MLGSLDGRVVAVANWVRLRDPRVAEVAFAVGDDFQRRGIGTRLLEQLAARAARGRDRGVRRGGAARQRRDARRVPRRRLRGRARRRRRRARDPVSRSRRPTAYREQVAERDHVAVRASLEPFFRPRSVAVIGASKPPRLDRRRALPQHPRRATSPAAAYPVNRKGDSVAGVHGYSAVGEIADGGRPRGHLPPGGARCSTRRRKRSTPASARSSSSPRASPRRAARASERQERLLALVREHGARLLGPNCLGIASTAVHLNATFAPRSFPPGKIGVLLPERRARPRAARARRRRRGLGVTSFVSIGNKADVSSNDLLEWWEDDDETEMVVLYLESFGNPRAFDAHRAAARAAQADPRAEGRDDARRQPRCRVAHGRARRLGRRGRRALPRCRRDPRPHARRADRRRVAALGAAGAARAARRGRHERRRARESSRPTRARRPGLELPTAERGDACRARRPSCRARAALANPIDMLGGANAESFEQALPPVLADPAFDAAIVLFVPTVGTDEEEVGAAISRAAATADGQAGALRVPQREGRSRGAAERRERSVLRVSRGGREGARARGRARRVAAAAGGHGARARVRSRRSRGGRARGARDRRRAGSTPSRRAACSRRTVCRSCPSASLRRRRTARRGGDASSASRSCSRRPRRARTRPSRAASILDLGRRGGRPRRRRADRRSGARAAVRPRRRRAPGGRRAGSRCSARSSRSARAASWPS